MDIEVVGARDDECWNVWWDIQYRSACKYRYCKTIYDLMMAGF